MTEKPSTEYIILIVGPINYKYLKGYSATDGSVRFDVYPFGATLRGIHHNGSRPTLCLIDSETHERIYGTLSGFHWYRNCLVPAMSKDTKIVWL